MEIDLPDGFSKPEGVKDEQPFTVSATVFVKGNKLCIEQVDGYDIDKEPDNDYDDKGFVKTYNDNVGGP